MFQQLKDDLSKGIRLITQGDIRGLMARMHAAIKRRRSERVDLLPRIHGFKEPCTIDDIFLFFEENSSNLNAGQVRSEFRKLLEAVFTSREKRPETILEIGTAFGGSLFSFCRLASENACIVSLDLPHGQFGGGYPACRIKLYEAFAKEKQKIHLIRGDSHDTKCLQKVEKIFDGKKIDFLFIDGDHTYEGTRKDFEMYSPLVRPGGMVAFHDIAFHPAHPDCRVKDYWDQIKNNYKHMEFVENPEQGWAGIGLLFMNDK